MSTDNQCCPNLCSECEFKDNKTKCTKCNYSTRFNLPENECKDSDKLRVYM